MRSCPDCDTSRLVRASVFDEHFWSNLALLALPFLLLTILSTFLYREGLRTSSARGEAGQDGAPHV